MTAKSKAEYAAILVREQETNKILAPANCQASVTMALAFGGACSPMYLMVEVKDLPKDKEMRLLGTQEEKKAWMANRRALKAAGYERAKEVLTSAGISFKTATYEGRISEMIIR